jgi:hypothetical protein
VLLGSSQRQREIFDPVTLGHIRSHGCRPILTYCDTGTTPPFRATLLLCVPKNPVRFDLTTESLKSAANRRRRHLWRLYRHGERTKAAIAEPQKCSALQKMRAGLM